MSYAKSGLDRFRKASLDTKDRDVAFSLLYALRLANADFECAASQVTPYSDDSRKEVQMSATAAALAFLKLAELIDEQRSYYKQLLDALPSRIPRVGSMLDKQAEHAASVDNAWKMLVPAAIAATYAVIEQDPATGLMSRLSLSASERDTILHRLRDVLGDGVTRGVQAGQMALVSAGAVLYEVIGNQGRPTRGEKDIRGQGATGQPPQKLGTFQEPAPSLNLPAQQSEISVSDPRPKHEIGETSHIDPLKYYLWRVESLIKRLWVAPPVAMSSKALSVLVKFRLERDGRVGRIDTERTSGNDYYDMSAHRAIRAAEPLPPFPRDLADRYFDVTFTFTAGGKR